MSETAVKNLEEGLQLFFKDHGHSNKISGKYAQIVIEPKFIINSKLNPEIVDLLVSVYLSQFNINDVKKGKIVIDNGVLIIKDAFGTPIAEVRNQSIIEQFTSRVGL
jgi:hypothetical protein